MTVSENKTLVLFDGFCHLCSRTVQFIIKSDRKKQFAFISLQSEEGQNIIRNNRVPAEIDSVLIFDSGDIFYYSEAIFYILKKLEFPYNLLLVFKIFPKKMLDKIYRWIAKNRFRWFGKRDSCYLPNNDDIMDKYSW